MADTKISDLTDGTTFGATDWLEIARDITNEKLEASNGLMPVPKGLGIGVTLDWDYLDTVTVSREAFKP